jgi:undecaprenyl-diphosphatase
MSLNQTVFLWIHHFAGRNHWLDGLGVFLAEWFPYFLVLGFLILVAGQPGWRKKFYWFAEGAIAIMVSRGLVTEIIRLLYHHERPFSFYHFAPLISEVGWSFPSGHAAWFFAMATAVWLMNKKWGTWFYLFALVNGIARIYVGVHWPLDVIGGIVVGIISAALVHWLLKTSRNNLYTEPAVMTPPI